MNNGGYNSSTKRRRLDEETSTFVECVEGEEGGVRWMVTFGDRGTLIYLSVEQLGLR